MYRSGTDSDRMMREPANNSSTSPEHLAQHLIALSPSAFADWVADHADQCSVALLVALKRQVSEQSNADPTAAQITLSRMDAMAAQLPHEPLALALCAWAYGDYARIREPHVALQHYATALACYRQEGEWLGVARLLGATIAMAANVGQIEQAETAYAEATALLQTIPQNAGNWQEYVEAQWVVEANYIYLLEEQGRYQEAVAASERLLVLVEQLGDPAHRVIILTNYAVTLVKLGRITEAQVMLNESQHQAQTCNLWFYHALADLNLGEILGALGEPVAALRHLLQARQLFLQLDVDQNALGTVSLLEAHILERIGASSAAIHAYALAYQTFTHLGMAFYRGEVAVSAARAQRGVGDYAYAWHLLDEAEAIWHQLNHPLWLLHTTLERIELALVWSAAPRSAGALLQTLDNHPLDTNANALRAWLALVRAEVALHEQSATEQFVPIDSRAHLTAPAMIEQALQQARHDQNPWLERRALAVQGRSWLARHPATARACFEAARDCDDHIRRQLSVEELKASFQHQTSDLAPFLIRLALSEQRPLEAVRAVWHAKASAVLDLMDERSVRQLAAGTNIQTELEEVRHQLAAARLQAAEHLQHTPSLEGADHLRMRVRSLEQHLADLRRQRLALAHPTTPLAFDDPFQVFAQTCATVVVEYMRCDDEVLAFRLDRAGDCRVCWLGSLAPLRRLLFGRLLPLLHTVVRQPALRQTNAAIWQDECLPLLHHCAAILLAPLGPFAPDDRLLIAPCDPLYQVPFAALWDGTHYLVQRHLIELTPSAALLLRSPPPAASGPPLAIAATQQGQFPANARQVLAVRQQFPASTVRIDDLGDLTVLGTLRTAPRLLHLAAHNDDRSNLAYDMALFTGLHITGGVFTVEHCFDLALNGTELVTLGGCTTGGGLQTGGSLLAFQSACFIAGARQVLATTWDVHSTDAAAWMEWFYPALVAQTVRDGHWDPAAALCAVQRAALDTSELHHPALWANFVCSRR